MRYLLFVFALCFLGLWSCAQAPDSTAKKRDSASAVRKRGFLERENERLTRLLTQRQEKMWERREDKIIEIENHPYRKADSATWSLSLNPLSILELQSALGIGVGYQVNLHWQVWLESSALFQMYPRPDQSALGGIREILAVKYYFGYRQSLFVAGEFRYKDIYYHDVANFDDNVNFLVRTNYTYKLENVVVGGAVWFGGMIRLSDDHRWRMELNVGLGVKGRTVIWHDVPRGYTYQKPRIFDNLSPVPADPARASAPAAFELPAAVRLIYVF